MNGAVHPAEEIPGHQDVDEETADHAGGTGKDEVGSLQPVPVHLHVGDSGNVVAVDTGVQQTFRHDRQIIEFAGRSPLAPADRSLRAGPGIAPGLPGSSA